MRLTEMQALDAAYAERFGAPAPMIPRDLGLVNVTLEWEYERLREAVARGVPVDWSAYFDPLPDGADS